MRILWHSNAPWVPTGYGQQTRLFTPLIKAMGHDVAISAMFGLGGSTSTYDGMNVYPSGYDAYGNDALPSYALHHLKHRDHGWLITLFDVWPLNNPYLKDFHTAAWVPVDHDPIPPNVLRFFTDTQTVPIAMSRFGQKALARFGVEALYVPHGFDPAFEPKDQAESREALGVPADAFVVGMNAANKAGKELHRKNFDGAFQAFARFAGQRDDAFLYVHTESTGLIGHNLENLAAYLQIEDKVRFADQFNYRLGVPTEYMPNLYSAFDVFLNPAFGEGFGVPIIEAQACGVPVIVTDFTAMSELAGPGWKVGGDLVWHEPNESMWMRPAVGGLVDALEEAHDARGVESLKDAAVAFAAPYRADRVFVEYWLPVLANLEERIYPEAVAA
jgi:glycosyltransferase involved in cell wall biosynthesis